MRPWCVTDPFRRQLLTVAQVAELESALERLRARKATSATLLQEIKVW
jgi:hypothetical protein